jgi:hypothetical protein
MTCSFVGEAYGTTNMYREYSRFKPLEWRRLSNEGGTGHVFDPLYAFVEYLKRESGTPFITEAESESEKIHAIF